MLDGMGKLLPGQPFPDEIFYRIFELPGNIERTQYIEALRSQARSLKRVSEFNAVLKAFLLDYTQKMRETDNVTCFTGQPLELQCGPWKANDFGVTMQRFDGHGVPVTVCACIHPIMPVRILKNVDTGKERIELKYFKYGSWQTTTVSRRCLADNSAIVDVLSDMGIEVTSENAKNLVRFISDCVGLNPSKLLPQRSIGRLGWSGNEFMPYADDIVYDGDDAYDTIYRNVHEGGSFYVWKEHCSQLRKNKIVRLAFAASFASCLIELVNALPFVFHIWSGESGTAKTVTIMAAMSLWGNPKMGGLVKTMNTTKVNIMRTSAFLYSIPYAGDELQTMKDKWTTNFDQLIYQITEGIDRGRGRASGGVEETRTWHCSYLFTGEEPITKQNSRAGSKNRVIEIEVEEQLIADGNHTVSILTENYGHAGKKLVEYLQNTDRSQLQMRYRAFFDEMCRLDTTEKQAMAMSCILLADQLLTEVIFTDEEAFTIDDVKQYLRSAQEVDVGENSYQSTLNWIAQNPLRFADPGAPGSANKGEVWGKIFEDEKHPEKPPVAIINKDVLADFLESAGYDYSAVSKKWARKDRLVPNSQGKFVHQTKVYGIKASYVKLCMEPTCTDPDGFMKIEDLEDYDNYEQQMLPFE